MLLPRGGHHRGVLCHGCFGQLRIEEPHYRREHCQRGAYREELKYDLAGIQRISVNLFQPDFTTATRLAASINGKVNAVEARAVDSGSVLIDMKKSARGDVASLVALIENIEVAVDGRPSSFSMSDGYRRHGENVRISTVAVAHGNLSIQIREEKEVSQPCPLRPRP